ncbi:DEAD/DEAH box helicase family protein [Prevotella communis]|uniref:DEAD/DEAH box helicase family protein n=1 Tax=Prevotella communis TaxID=2913614 RepID=UPI00210796CC|nr:DEAD/DEAH box helicase family protein [Prevotella communis]
MQKNHPNWEFEHDATEFTIHMATGVGKTRLIGALIAYLYLSKESHNFMIISSRTEIIRKFIAVCTGLKDYLFVDQSLVDYPTVFNSESSVRDFTQSGMFDGGPRIWVISPQSLTANNARMKFKGQFDKCSPVEYIQSLDDLVIFFDESHHLGLDSEQDSVWRKELNALNPKMIIGTTASISENQNNIMYSYDLKRCLNEHLYTKFVRMLPDKKSDVISDEEYDHMTLRFALQRLETKQKFLDDYCRVNEIDQKVKATMLVACEDKKHAEATTKWLKNYLENKDAVLMVHSGLNENEFVPKLKSIEDPDTPVKVVVNVMMLNEGWDVSNIYVIAPLRSMASTTLVTQIMGRGLRLPFGHQVGDVEVDTLDVLCFGHETMQDIVAKLTQQGFGANNRRGITVTSPVDPNKPDTEFVQKKKIFLNVVDEEKVLCIPQYKMNKAPLPLDDISIPPLKPQDVHYFLINELTIKRLGTSVEFDREGFISMVTTDVIKQCTYLKFRSHFMKVKNLVMRFLEASKFTEDTIKLDPARVIAHIKDNLDKLSRQQPVSYERLTEDLMIDLTKIDINVPETYEHPFLCSMPVEDWVNKTHKGIPFAGWQRCSYEAVPFDTPNEYRIARVIDTSDDVKKWFRNLPGIITLLTPVGNYSPDFAIFLDLDDKNILLELKDDDRFGGEDQDATIKANAAREWCKAQSLASGKPWEYWLLLDSDAEFCETFDDISESVEKE